MGEGERRGEPRRRTDDRDAWVGFNEAMRTLQVALDRARHAQHLAEQERDALERERSAYRAVRRQDEVDRWETGGGAAGPGSRRGRTTVRQDIYESDFTDFQRMTRGPRRGD